MKKLFAFFATLILILSLLTGCGAAYVPPSTIRWAEEETLKYNVRRASDFELTYIGITGITDENGVFQTPNLQIIPSDAQGSYETSVSFNSAEGTYTVSSTLNVTEIYSKKLFAADMDLHATALQKAAESNIMRIDGEDIVVDVSVISICTFKATGMLPVSSSKTVKSVFIGAGVCAENDFLTTVTYDYSQKKPYANVTTLAGGKTTENSIKLKNGVKTYDNEQIELLLRSFSLSSLATAGGASINIFDGRGLSGVMAANAVVPKAYSFDYQLGGVWKDVESNGNLVYYKEGENYTDVKGKIIETIKRNVSIIGFNGLNMIYYFDSEDTAARDKQVLIRMQQSYLVFDITPESLFQI